MENEEKIYCLLIDDYVTPVDCMENTVIKDEFIPEKFKQKENWREICKNCKYYDY